MNYVRNHVFICPECAVDLSFKNAKKFCLEDYQSAFGTQCEFVNLIEKLKMMSLLPKDIDLSIFSAEDDKFRDLSKVRETLLTAAGFCDQSISLNSLLKIMGFGVPAILLCKAPCDYLGFDRTNYRFSCTLKEEKAAIGEDEKNDSCYKGYENKICSQDYSDQETLMFLQEFYNKFPNIRWDENNREGIIPLFMFSFFIDFLIFQSFFGEHIFKRRFDYNDKYKKLATGIAEDIISENLSKSEKNGNR